ncbi:MAG: sigma 54-interacting transcriptional regulator [Syntrophomonas sp.]|nr:sigma 54-interacting transcriptional regulator [Syntrophomonas sp.]
MDYQKYSWNTNRSLVLIEDMMNKQIQVIHPGDSFRTAIGIFSKNKQETIPVVDDKGMLIGVLSNSRLYKALLDGISLDDSCTPYIIDSPKFFSAGTNYNTISQMMSENNKSLGNVPVVDENGKVVGIAGNKEYLKTSLSLRDKSNVLLESIFQAMQEGIITVDRKGCILRINQAAQKMFDITLPEIQGLHINDVFPEIKYTGKRSLGLRCKIRSVAVIAYQSPIMEHRKQIGTNLIFLDVTDAEAIAKELEIVNELQTSLMGVLSASSDGVFVTDKSGVVKYVNEMGKQLVGGKNSRISRRSIDDFLRTSSRNKVANTGIPEVDTCRINDKNCMVSHVPLKNGKENDTRPFGVVSTVYLDNNRVAEELSRKWFSLRQQISYYRGQLEKHGAGEKDSFEHIVTNNSDFIQIKREAQQIAKSTSTVLLTGESGVGKDIFARAIHAAGPRAKRPFVKVNCVAIPETLFESELFGYAPGSFTGASKKGKIGYFEQAHQGTIFLDEIGDMPMSVQVKILQVLQDKQFMLVGGKSTQEVDVRIVAATNRNLREAISKGTFREDLYYRLNVIELFLPPLRVRSEDILPLAETFIEKYNDILGTSVVGMSRRTKEALKNYSWPGNIRELENAIERAANYVWDGEIDVEHLPPHIIRAEKSSYEQSSYQMVINDVNKEIILDALRKTNGNRSAAARMLKISRSAFYEKLSKYDII